eukprot:gene5057-10127_t
MGTCFGNQKELFIYDPKIPGHGDRTRELFDRLEMEQHEIDTLFQYFTQLDHDTVEMILLQELCSCFDMVDPPESIKKIFLTLDPDGTHRINFVEFVCVIWNLLTLSREGLASYIITLFQGGDKSRISLADAKNILSTIHGKDIDQTPNLKSVLEILQNSGDEITATQFIKILVENESCLSPIIELQLNLKKRMGDAKFWDKIVLRRKQNPEMTHGSFVFDLKDEIVILRHEIAFTLKKYPSSLNFSGQRKIARSNSVVLLYAKYKPTHNSIHKHKSKFKVPDDPKHLKKRLSKSDSVRLFLKKKKNSITKFNENHSFRESKKIVALDKTEDLDHSLWMQLILFYCKFLTAALV